MRNGKRDLKIQGGKSENANMQEYKKDWKM